MLYSSGCWGTKSTCFFEEWRQHFKFLVLIETFSCLLSRQLGAHTFLKRQLIWENIFPSSITSRLLAPGDIGEFSHTVPDLQEVFPCSCYHLKDFALELDLGLVLILQADFSVLSTACSNSLEVLGSGLTTTPYLHRIWHRKHITPLNSSPVPEHLPSFLLINSTITWKMVMTNCQVIHTE